VRTRMAPLRQLDASEIDRNLDDLAQMGRRKLVEENGVPEGAVRFVRSLEMRYVGQKHETEVVLDGSLVSLEAIEAQFHRLYEQAYGHCRPGEALELVNFRVRAIGALAKPGLVVTGQAASSVAEAMVETREVYFDGQFQAVPVYWRDRLPPQQPFRGPCIVEEAGSTSVITPRFRGHVDAWGNIVLQAGTA